MAEETKPEDLTKSDDTIDLESLVRNIDQVAADSIKSPKAGSSSDTAAAPAAAKPTAVKAPKSEPAPDEPVHAEALPIDQVDDLLAQEDPEMAAQLEAMRKEGFEAEDAPDLAQEDAAVDEVLRSKTKTTFGERLQFFTLKIRSRLRVLRTLAKRALTDSKGVLREGAIRAKIASIAWLRNRQATLASGMAWLKARSTSQKLSLVLALLTLAVLSWIALQTMKGTLLPKTEKPWIASFSEHADGVFKYDLEGAFEDFNDPLLHPEFVILIERVVVNLARTAEAQDGANPMAAFELYLQTDNQETAVEIKDRDVEIRDAVARSVERMTYPDLVGEEGKAKLKLLIRKDLNEILTKGKIRRVFFKTIVLNPE